MYFTLFTPFVLHYSLISLLLSIFAVNIILNDHLYFFITLIGNFKNIFCVIIIPLLAQKLIFPIQTLISGRSKNQQAPCNFSSVVSAMGKGGKKSPQKD